MVRSDEAKEGVEMQMCWIRLLHVVTPSYGVIGWRIFDVGGVRVTEPPGQRSPTPPTSQVGLHITLGGGFNTSQIPRNPCQVGKS